MSERTKRQRPRKGGRPSKGERHLFQSRVPVGLADTIMDESERLGMTFSDYIALVLAEKHDYPLPAHYNSRRTDSVQEALPMKTAS